MTRISLTDALTELRQQLTQAMQVGQDEKIRFEIKNIELELALEVSSNVKGEAKANWWVLEFGTEAESGRQKTHSVKLIIEPSDLGREDKILEISRKGKDFE